MTEYTFRIPSPPSTNALYANKPGKGRVKSERYRVWKNAAGWQMKVENGNARSWKTISGPVAVIILSPGRKDIDNNKAVLDLLTDMAVIGDDRQVESLHVARTDGKECIVTVRSLGRSAA